MSEAKGTSWKEEVRAVWPYATSVSSLLFGACALVGLVSAWKSGAKGALSYVLAVTDPAFAALAMLVICVACPAVYLGDRFRFPHVLTLPTLYVAVVYGIKSLSRNSAGSLQRYEGAERSDLLWLDWHVVALAWVALVIVFFVVSALARIPKPEPS